MLWQEKEPDFAFTAVDEITRVIPFPESLLAITLPSAAPLVVFRRSVEARIMQHLSTKKLELGGLLIGRAARREGSGGYLVLIEQHAEAGDVESSSVSLVMGTTVWERARHSAVAGQTVVGWYHSHPNLGAFFSGTDRRTQRAFFQQEHQLGLCIDPIQNQEAWFFGPDSRSLEQASIVRVGDRGVTQ